MKAGRLLSVNVGGPRQIEWEGKTVRTAIEEDLTPRQREVFVAIALNDVPIDVLAVELATNRNAIYKNLFDARRKLRECLAAAGHPVVAETEART